MFLAPMAQATPWHPAGLKAEWECGDAQRVTRPAVTIWPQAAVCSLQVRSRQGLTLPRPQGEVALDRSIASGKAPGAGMKSGLFVSRATHFLFHHLLASTLLLRTAGICILKGARSGGPLTCPPSVEETGKIPLYVQSRERKTVLKTRVFGDR